MAASWLALLLAEAGWFSVGPCLGFSALCAVLVFLRSRASPGSLHGLLVLALALGTLVFTRYPGELLLGGWDPGVYLHTGANIARSGALLVSAPDLNRLTADELAVLTRTTSNILGPFSGMWMLPDGRLSPQFHHLYPSLLAIAFALGGIKAALLVNPMLNVGCIVAFYALARRMVRPSYALAAAALLALNPAQLWQAKFCTAELLGQFLLLGGAAFFLDAVRGIDARRSGLLAGVAFGLALLARYDTIILLAPLAALTVAVLPWLPSRRGALWCGVGLAPLIGHHLVHHHHFAPYYQPVSGLVLQALAVVAVGLVLWLMALRVTSLRRLLEARARWLRMLAAAGVGAWCCFAWARPYFPAGWPATGEDAGNALFLNAIFGPGLIVYVAALLVWLHRERDVTKAIWLYASVAVLAVVTTRVFNDHFLMWVARRFIPVAIPLLVLSLAAALDHLSAATARRRGVATALFVAVLALNFSATRAMAVLRDWPGVTDWTARVAAALPPAAAVYSDQWGFTSPLRFIHGLRAYEMHGPRDDAARARLCAVMSAAAKRGERVFFLSLQAPPSTVSWVETGRFPLASQRTETSRTQVPRKTRASGGDFVLYEIKAQ